MLSQTNYLISLILQQFVIQIKKRIFTSMKNSVVLWFLILLSWSVFSQSNETFILEDEPTKELKKKHPVFTEIDFGTTMMYAGKNHYAFGTYVHPKISYKLTPRFQVSMGLMAVRSSLNNYTYYNYEGLAQDVNYKGLSAYYTLQGAYLLTEDLKIYGGIMLGNHFSDTGFKSSNASKNPKAYQLGLEYKFGDCSIQLEFIYQESDFANDFFWQENNRMTRSPFMQNSPF